jgi:membrane protein YqaA with SNARE-associated domain
VILLGYLTVILDHDFSLLGSSYQFKCGFSRRSDPGYMNFIQLFPALLFGSWAQKLFSFFAALGLPGVFILAGLDSSFLFMPFGNDLLLIALISANPTVTRAIVYTLVLSVGSVAGVLLVDVLSRKAGEEGLEHFVKPKKIANLKKKMDQHFGWAVFLGSILPPPFPFTAVVMTAAALQYSRRKLLLTVLAGRLLRFSVEAALGLYLGKKILDLMNSKVVEYFVYAIVVIAVVGSIFSILKWTSRGKPRPRTTLNSETSEA